MSANRRLLVPWRGHCSIVLEPNNKLFMDNVPNRAINQVCIAGAGY